MSTLLSALLPQSSLRAGVRSGRQALGPYAGRILEKTSRVSDSLDFDASLMRVHPSLARWDYLLGLLTQGTRKAGPILAVEVHSATDGKVREVIRKKQDSGPLIRSHLTPGSTVARWIWIASGSTRFLRTSKYRRRLAEARIEFVGKHLEV